MPYVARHVSPHGLCREIAQFLQTQGCGTLGSSLRLWALPDTPYVCRAISPQGGPRAPGSPVDFVRFSIVVRDTNITSASVMAQHIFEALSDRSPSLSSFTGQVTADVHPGLTYRDANNLEVFSLNFLFTGMVRVI